MRARNALNASSSHSDVPVKANAEISAAATTAHASSAAAALSRIRMGACSLAGPGQTSPFERTPVLTRGTRIAQSRAPSSEGLVVIVALIIVSVALAITIGILLFGAPRGALSEEARAQIESESKARQAAEAELEKRRKEFEEQKSALSEVKDQLKQAKRKLF